MIVSAAAAAAQQPVLPVPKEQIVPPPLASDLRDEPRPSIGNNEAWAIADTDPPIQTLREIGRKELRIVNRTGLASKRVEASNWETPAARPPRVLDVRVRATGETLVDFNDGVRDCRYRVTILFEDGRTFSDPALNACTQKEVVITAGQLRPAR